jgi:hypothetical protein
LDLPVGNVNSLALFARAREYGAMDDDGLLFFERRCFVRPMLVSSECQEESGGHDGQLYRVTCYMAGATELRMERSVGIKQVQTVRSTSEDEPPAPQTHI